MSDDSHTDQGASDGRSPENKPKDTKSITHVSLKDANDAAREAAGTLDNTYDMFPVGTQVQVVCLHRDFRMFRGIETGTVIRNDKRYLGIIVLFDAPYDKYGQDFNFEPVDLKVVTPVSDLAAPIPDATNQRPASLHSAPDTDRMNQILSASQGKLVALFREKFDEEVESEAMLELIASVQLYASSCMHQMAVQP